jgi:hypothetical protein
MLMKPNEARRGRLVRTFCAPVRGDPWSAPACCGVGLSRGFRQGRGDSTNSPERFPLRRLPGLRTMPPARSPGHGVRPSMVPV